ncbi:unnamed protein product [Closterium sp. Naga37s-1]|nr:unnamed protein product [Closterium sp. Naga37s-1]
MAINPHLGTPEELKALVDAAHAMGFLVMIDGAPRLLFSPCFFPSSQLPLLLSARPSPHPPVVLNHVGCPQGGGPCDTWQEGIRPPPWLNDSYAPFNESASFHPPCEVDFSQYDTDNWQRCWLASLPDFNQSNPAVAAALVRSTAYLVHTFGFDAIRVDAAHHMPPEFVRSLASHLQVPAFAELSIPSLPLLHRLLAGRVYTVSHLAATAPSPPSLPPRSPRFCTAFHPLAAPPPSTAGRESVHGKYVCGGATPSTAGRESVHGKYVCGGATPSTAGYNPDPEELSFLRRL